MNFLYLAFGLLIIAAAFSAYKLAIGLRIGEARGIDVCCKCTELRDYYLNGGGRSIESCKTNQWPRPLAQEWDDMDAVKRGLPLLPIQFWDVERIEGGFLLLIFESPKGVIWGDAIADAGLPNPVITKEILEWFKFVIDHRDI